MLDEATLKGWAQQAFPLKHEAGAGLGAGIWFRGPTHAARACAILLGRPLPGDPGQNRTSLVFSLEDGRKVSVIRLVTVRRGDEVRIRIQPTAAERRERARCLSAQLAAEAVAQVPATEGAFRSRAEDSFLRVYAFMKQALFRADDASGFAFDADVAERFDQLAAVMYRELMEAPIAEDVRRRAAGHAALTARFDGQLQVFLASAIRRAAVNVAAGGG